MNNKVKITYALDLDKVPSKSQELLTEACHWLNGALAKLESLHFDDAEASFQKMLEKADQVRHALADVDQRIDDCLAVMSGYHKTMIDLSAPSEPEPQPDDSQVHYPHEIEETRIEAERQFEELQKQLTSMSPLSKKEDDE